MTLHLKHKPFKLLLLLLPIFCVFVFSDNTFAVSNISVTTNSWSANDSVFPDCDSTCLSQYHYLTISSESLPNDSNLFFVYGTNQYLNVTFPNYNGQFNTGFSLTFPFDYTSFRFRHTKSTSSFTFTHSGQSGSSGSGQDSWNPGAVSESVNVNEEVDLV